MTARLKKIAIFGEGIYSGSTLITRQRRLNCYLEVRKDADRSSIVCLGTPGLKRAFSANVNLPVRGMIGNSGALYMVTGTSLTSVTSTGIVVGAGSIGTIQGLVGMALNPTQVLVVDGSKGYVYTPGTNIIVIVGGAFPNGALTAAYCNGFFICELPGTNQFFVSAFNDGTSWNGLGFASAVQAIDGINAVDTLGGLLIIFSTGHTEFWQNAGLLQEPFQYIQNSASMYGLAAVNSRVHAGESLLFLTRTNGGSFQNAGGNYQIAQIRGYQVTPVSNPDVDRILQDMASTSTVADCTAYSYQVGSHVMAQFNFPTANRSLLFDTHEKLWSEVQSGITQGYAARHLGNLAAGAFNQTFVSDYSNSNIYTYDPKVYTDNGNTIVREVISRTALDDYNMMSIGRIYFDMRTGVGLSDPTLQGYDPQVGVSIARNNGPFGVERMVPLGQQGDTLVRVNTRRWGRARSAAVKLRMTDPVPFEVAGGGIVVANRAGTQKRAA